MNINMHNVSRAEFDALGDDWFSLTVIDDKGNEVSLFFNSDNYEKADAIVNAVNAATGYQP